MKKIVIALFLLIIAMASISAINSSYASSTATIQVDSATQNFPSAHVGDTIQVNITISGVQNLWAWDLPGISFNPAVLSLVNVTEGPFLQQIGQTTFIWTSSSTLAISKGIIPDTSDLLLVAAGASGNGVLATLNFHVVSLGTSQLDFNGSTLLDPSQISTVNTPVAMSSNAVNATLTIGSASSSSNPTPTPTNASTSSPSNTASTSSSPSPTSSPGSNTVPEFPILLIILPLLIAATASILLISKKANSQKQ